MAAAEDALVIFQGLVRRLLLKLGGYECQAAEGEFMLAFEHPTQAVYFSLLVGGCLLLLHDCLLGNMQPAVVTDGCGLRTRKFGMACVCFADRVTHAGSMHHPHCTNLSTQNARSSIQAVLLADLAVEAAATQAASTCMCA